MGEMFMFKTFEKHSCMDENDSKYITNNRKYRGPHKFRGHRRGHLEISVHMQLRR